MKGYSPIAFLLFFVVVSVHAATVRQAASTACETAVVGGLTRQIVAVLNQMNPGSFTDLSKGPDAGLFRFSQSAQPFLQTSAAAALVRVARARGTTMTVNSALRSIAQQVLLYQWYRSGRCGIRLAAKPGNSNHQSGAAVDVEDHGGWNSFFSRNGWRWYGPSDTVHFDFLAGDARFKQDAIRAFQKLWNANNPNAKIAENGVYSSQVENAVLSSPAEGFANAGLIRPPAPAPAPPAPAPAPPAPVPPAADPAPPAPPAVDPAGPVRAPAANPPVRDPAPAPAPPADPAPAPAPPAAPARRVKCTLREINIRDKGGLSGAVVATTGVGDAFVLTGASVVSDGFTWFKVEKCGGGASGWMAMKDSWQRDCECAAAAPAPAAPAPVVEQAVNAPAPVQRARSATVAQATAAQPAKCTTKQINIRNRAGVSGTLVATSGIGEAYVLSGAGIAADGFTWFQVTKCGGGVSGFMAIRPDWQTDCTCGGTDNGGGGTPTDGSTAAEWERVIRTIEPRAASWVVSGVAAALPDLISKYQLTTNNRLAYFLAQTAHESAGFTTTTEFASGREYEGRRDLGNTQPGDGVRFKGRGIIQLTGRANYGTYGRILGADFVGNPELAAKFPWAALTAGEYWKQRGINSCADSGDFVCATRRINGGTNGLSDRQRYLARANTALAARRNNARAGVTGGTAAEGFPTWAIGLIAGLCVLIVLCVTLIVLMIVRANKKTTVIRQDKDALDRSALMRKSVMSQDFAVTSSSGSVPSLRRK